MTTEFEIGSYVSFMKCERVPGYIHPWTSGKGGNCVSNTYNTWLFECPYFLQQLIRLACSVKGLDGCNSTSFIQIFYFTCAELQIANNVFDFTISKWLIIEEIKISLKFWLHLYSYNLLTRISLIRFVIQYLSLARTLSIIQSKA